MSSVSNDIARCLSEAAEQNDVGRYDDLTPEMRRNFELLKEVRLEHFGSGSVDLWRPVVRYETRSGWTVEARLAGRDGSWVNWEVEPPSVHYRSEKSGKASSPSGQVDYEWDLGALSRVPVDQLSGTCKVADFKPEVEGRLAQFAGRIAPSDASEVRSLKELRDALVREGLDVGGSKPFERSWYPERGRPADADVSVIRVGGRKVSVVEDFLIRHGGRFGNAYADEGTEKVRLYCYHVNDGNRYLAVSFRKSGSPAMTYCFVDEDGVPRDRFGGRLK